MIVAAPIFHFFRRDTIAFGLGWNGDISAIGSVTVEAALGSAFNGNAFGGTPVAVFTVVSRPADGDVPAGWNLVIDDQDIAPGEYVADARLVLDGFDKTLRIGKVVISESVLA